LHIGGPFLGAIPGAVAGAIGRVRLGATVGATTVALSLLLVAICSVVDLDQVVEMGLVLLIAGGLAGTTGGALGKLMARSELAQLDLKDFLTILFSGLAGAFVGFCCSLVGFSMYPRPGDDLAEAAFYLGAPFLGAIAGALGRAIRRAWLSAMHKATRGAYARSLRYNPPKIAHSTSAPAKARFSVAAAANTMLIPAVAPNKLRTVN
jgi:hypothetical protein